MFTTTTAALKAALTALTTGTKGREALIGGKGSLAILRCVLLTAAPTGAPQLTGCDLDMMATTTLPGTASRGLRLAVDARDLKAAVADLPCAEVKLEDVGGAITVRSADGTGATLRLACQDVSDFPTIPHGSDWPASFDLPAAQLWHDLGRAMVSCSTEEYRYYLNGVLFHVTSDAKLRMVTTDGHRLTVIERDQPEGAAKLPDIILPSKAAAFLTRVLKKADGAARMMATASKAKVKAGGWILTSKLIDGTFPDYTRVIPQYNQHHVTADPKALAADIKALTSHQGTNKAFTLSAGDGWATGWANSAENGAAGAVLSSAGGTSTSETTFAAFNGDYLRDTLGQFKGEVTIDLEDYAAPTRFTSPTSPELTAVLMPIRVENYAIEPSDIARLNMSPMERLEEVGPSICTATLVSYRDRFSKLVTAAIDSIADGDRHAARVIVMAKVEAMREQPGRYTAQLERQPVGDYAGDYAGWHAWTADLARYWRFHAGEARAARVTENVTPTGREELLERRVRRLEAVLAGRKAQLATVGQALAQSQARNSAMRRRLASAGTSPLAGAIRQATPADQAA